MIIGALREQRPFYFVCCEWGRHGLFLYGLAPLMSKKWQFCQKNDVTLLRYSIIQGLLRRENGENAERK